MYYLVTVSIISSAITELETALSSYNSLPRPPIWAVAENYRFQPAFEEVHDYIYFVL